MQADFASAAYLAAQYMCVILKAYRDAGWDPCQEGSISCLELVATAYSLGPRPKRNPRTNARGRQVAQLARDAKRIFGLPDCDCCDCGEREPGGTEDTSIGKLRAWEAELKHHDAAKKKILGGGDTSMGSLRAWEAEVERHRRALKRLFRHGEQN